MEKNLENRFRQYVRTLGGFALKFSPVGIKGFPDRVVLLPGGRIGFAELKHPEKTGRVSDSQIRATRTLRILGFKTIISDSFDELRAWVDGL